MSRAEREKARNKERQARRKEERERQKREREGKRAGTGPNDRNESTEQKDLSRNEGGGGGLSVSGGAIKKYGESRRDRRKRNDSGRTNNPSKETGKYNDGDIHEATAHQSTYVNYIFNELNEFILMI